MTNQFDRVRLGTEQVYTVLTHQFHCRIQTIQYNHRIMIQPIDTIITDIIITYTTIIIIILFINNSNNYNNNKIKNNNNNNNYNKSNNNTNNIN